MAYAVAFQLGKFGPLPKEMWDESIKVRRAPLDCALPICCDFLSCALPRFLLLGTNQADTIFIGPGTKRDDQLDPLYRILQLHRDHLERV